MSETSPSFLLAKCTFLIFGHSFILEKQLISVTSINITFSDSHCHKLSAGKIDDKSSLICAGRGYSHVPSVDYVNGVIRAVVKMVFPGRRLHEAIVINAYKTVSGCTADFIP